MHAALKPGLRHSAQYTVPPGKTVPHLYPEFVEFTEMPPVFATGFLVGLMEAVCQLAIKPHLDWPREQSLGTQVCFTHLAATPAGLTITVSCEVTAVEGRKVCFKASAHDGHDLISEGTHERVVIDVARFNARLAGKLAAGLADRADLTGLKERTGCTGLPQALPVGANADAMAHQHAINGDPPQGHDDHR